MAADIFFILEKRMWGEGGGKSHTHRHAGRIVVVLEGMEEVAS